MLEVFSPSRKWHPRSGLRPLLFAFLERPLAPKRENMKWSKKEREGLEEAFVWFITKETSRTKLFQVETSVKLVQRPSQAMTSAYSTSGQEDGRFPPEEHRLNLQGICQT